MGANVSEWLSIKDCVRILGLGRDFLYRERKLGRIKFARFNRSLRIRRAEWDKYLARAEKAK